MNTGKNLLENALEVFNTKSREYGPVDQNIAKYLKAVFPNGIKSEKINDAIFTIRILEKLSRILSENISEQSKTDAYRDIVGYGLLGLDLLQTQDK